MRELVAYGICAIVVLYGIKKSINTTFSERTFKYSINKILYYFSILLTFFMIITNISLVMNIVVKFKLQYLTFVYNTKYTNTVILVIFFCVSQNVIYLVLKLLSSPILSMCKQYEKRAVWLSLVSAFLGCVKGLIILLILFVGVVTFNRTIGTERQISLFNNISAFNKIEEVISNKSENIRKSFSIEDDAVNASSIIVYYNGVTLEEGIQSNEEIDNKANEITKFCEDDRSKAKRIYTWIGTNIEYDSEKASKALREEVLDGSGSVTAWNTRKGICFDYACLYVSMCRAVNLKVRLVTGEAFDGKAYGSHAWNQVYLADEGIWVNVDPTFYISGDYFDTNLFNEDHIEEEIAGEW